MRLLKTKLLLCLVVIVTLTIFVISIDGCAKPAPAPTPTPTPTPVPPIELVLATGNPATSFSMSVSVRDWIAEIEEATDNRVHIRTVFDGALLSFVESLDGVKAGIADISWLYLGYWSAEFPVLSNLSSIIDLNLGKKLGLIGQAAVTHQMMDDFPEFREGFEQQGLTYLFHGSAAAYALWCREPIRTFEDLKGKRFRTTGTRLPLLAEAAGAIPMSVDWGEIYTALDTGLCDIATTDPVSGYPMKWHEPAPWVVRLEAQNASITSAWAINSNSLHRLSKADQETFLRISWEMGPYFAKQMAGYIPELYAMYEADGATVYDFPEEEVAKWAAACPDWYGIAVKELNEKGLPGTEYMARYVKLANDYISGKWKPEGY